MTLLPLLFSAAWGQAYEAQPCEPTPTLAAELAAGTVGQVSPRGPRFLGAAASSLLPPPKSAKPDHAAAKALIDSIPLEVGELEVGLPVVAADLLSCTYGPTNLLDGDPATAWCEAADGPGVGEVVVVRLPGDGPLTVRNGYGKSADRFAENARVRKVEVVLLGQGWMPAVQGQLWSDLPVLGRHELELTDTRDPQALPLPPAKAPVDYAPKVPDYIELADQKPAFVALRILSTWPGSRWQDTCLSEIAPAKL